ncbi:MAG: response regulator [Clostridia bacterium]|nr:response regulator [Clostridia bacterium]
MITAILVDDMRPALRELEFLLNKYPDITIDGMYTNPLAAIEKIGETKPQAVFLDINMPQLQGMDAASKILDVSPETDIVFVTAYDQYAVEAFELHAMDYLLKPISEERLEKTIERIRKKAPAERKQDSSKLQIRCFNRFRMGWEGREPIKWRIEKARELFAYLLQNHGRSIFRDELLDKLWPEDDPDRAVKQLYNGTYYIRKALEAYGIDKSLISINNSYNLTLGPVDWDVGRYCELFENHNEDRPRALEKMEALYAGGYLEGEFYPWSDFEGERLSKLYDQCVIELSKSYMSEKKYNQAENILLKAYHKNPYLEDISELLLKLYRETGNTGMAIKHYNTYAALIKEELGISPDKKLRELVK